MNASGSRSSEKRCDWAAGDALLIEYHDMEWGTPEHEDRRLFEFLVLEGTQAGLSWLTVLRKRESYRKAFDRFDPEKIARYTAGKARALMANRQIIRNRLKIESTITNAKAFLGVRAEFGSFDAYVWRFVRGRTKQNRWRHLREIPTKTSESDEMSQALRKRGFRFVGSTICYAYMQAVGMVNDHLVSCFRHPAVQVGTDLPRKDRSDAAPTRER